MFTIRIGTTTWLKLHFLVVEILQINYHQEICMFGWGSSQLSRCAEKIRRHGRRKILVLIFCSRKMFRFRSPWPGLRRTTLNSSSCPRPRVFEDHSSRPRPEKLRTTRPRPVLVPRFQGGPSQYDSSRPTDPWPSPRWFNSGRFGFLCVTFRWQKLSSVASSLIHDCPVLVFWTVHFRLDPKLPWARFIKINPRLSTRSYSK